MQSGSKAAAQSISTSMKICIWSELLGLWIFDLSVLHILSKGLGISTKFLLCCSLMLYWTVLVILLIKTSCTSWWKLMEEQHARCSAASAFTAVLWVTNLLWKHSQGTAALTISDYKTGMFIRCRLSSWLCMYDFNTKCFEQQFTFCHMREKVRKIHHFLSIVTLSFLWVV